MGCVKRWIEGDLLHPLPSGERDADVVGMPSLKLSVGEIEGLPNDGTDSACLHSFDQATAEFN